MPETTNDVTELRPSSEEYLQGLRSRGKWLAPIFLIFGARAVFGVFEGGLDAFLGAMVLLVLVGSLGAAAVHIRTSLVRLRPGHLDHDGFFVRRRTIAVDGARGLLAPMSQPLAPTVDVLVVQSRRAETFRIAGGLWTRDDLETIAAHAGVEILYRETSARNFEAWAPGSIPLRFRRPFSFALLVGVPLLSAVVVGTYMWFVVTDTPMGG